MGGLSTAAARLLGGDALGFVLGLALLVALALTMPRALRPKLRLPVGCFALHVVALVAARALPISADLASSLALVGRVLLLASMARGGVLLLADVVLTERLKRPPSRITRDIAQGAAYAAVALLALRELGVEPGSLLTTSALLTAVIGLSLQETLGNLFAGVAIQAQRPFELDDWIQFDGDMKHIGRVVEMNWRATKVITLDDVEVIVPNSALAKAPIVNFTKPTLTSRRSIYFVAAYDAPPAEVAAAVLEALASTPGVLASPPPSCVTNQFVDRGVEYWARFFTDEFHRRDVVDGLARDHVWYALARRGVAMPIPAHAVELREVSPQSELARDEAARGARARTLGGVDLFQVLAEADLGALAANSRERPFAPGEVVVREGHAGGELYVVERGEVSVLVARGKGEHEVARLAAGQFFGEMALMTGDVRHATVRAATACRLLEVPQAALKPLLDASPDLALRISEVLAKRQADLDARAAAHDGDRDKDLGERTSQLFDKVRRFFSLA